jgi:pimeloyl-ACP methyl ester carboxylesterase
LPGAKLAIMAQAGHVPQEEQPTAFMQALVAFVKTLL